VAAADIYIFRPQGSKGKAAVVGLGDKVPQKLKQFVDIVSDSWPVCFMQCRT